MPKFACRCGTVINLSPIPCPNEKFLMESGDFYQIIESLDSQAYKQAERMLVEVTLSVISCGSCGRYYVKKDKDSYEYLSFVPEVDNPPTVDTSNN